jgi:hypothetical protein
MIINTLEQFVAHMNEHDNSGRLAANYALEACEEAGYQQTIENIEGHLDVLFEAGAEFDYNEAIAMAIGE